MKKYILETSKFFMLCLLISSFFISSNNLFAISTQYSIIPNPVDLEAMKKSSKETYLKYSNVNGYSATGSYLTIKNNGDVEYGAVTKRGAKAYTKKLTLSKKDFDTLKSLIAKAEVSKLKDSYRCDKLCPTDLNSISLKFFNINGKDKSIGMYAPKNVPIALTNVINKLNEINKLASNSK